MDKTKKPRVYGAKALLYDPSLIVFSEETFPDSKYKPILDRRKKRRSKENTHS